jgi:hypothetical protein
MGKQSKKTTYHNIWGVVCGISLLLSGGALAQFAQNRTLPTEFPIDCREVAKRPTAPATAVQEWNWRCQRPADQWAKGARFGTGIGPAQLMSGFPTKPGSSRYWGGFLDDAARKIYIGSTWSDNRDKNGDPTLKNFGVIYEVDINFKNPSTVGNRRVVSGKYLSRQGDVEVGTGDKLSTVRTIRRGKDGMLYAFTMDAGNPATIVKVDPTTGNRTTLWTEKSILHSDKIPTPKDQCEQGTVPQAPGVMGSVPAGSRRTMQINGGFSPFEMNPNTGEFYLIPLQQSNSTPAGILKISADGTECSWVTRMKASGNNRYADDAKTKADPSYGQPSGMGSRGTGITNMTFAGTNVYYHEIKGEAWLYVSSGNTYWRANVKTGNRELVVQSETGDTGSVWDSSRNFLWTSGTGNGSAIAPVTINTEDDPKVLGNLFCLNPSAEWFQCIRGPGEIGPMLRGGLFFDPSDNNLIYAHDTVGLIRLEVKTGNSYIFSL